MGKLGLGLLAALATLHTAAVAAGEGSDIKIVIERQLLACDRPIRNG